MGIENFDLKKFREEFLQSDGWQVSDCYKPYDDKFLRKDAQDAYEGAKWAWAKQQKKIDGAKKEINNFFDNQTQKPTDREYCNKLADILELLK